MQYVSQDSKFSLPQSQTYLAGLYILYNFYLSLTLK